MWLMCNDNNQRKRDRGFERAGEWEHDRSQREGAWKTKGRKQNGENDVAIFKLIFLKEKTVKI